MEAGGGGDRGELGFREIETTAEGFTRPDIFHILKEILGFVLYMHHQIPSILQHLEDEFDDLKEELKTLEETNLSPTESKVSLQRKILSRKRQVKQGIRRLQKLMSSISSVLSALQLALGEASEVEEVALILGGSLVRPRHVYQLVLPKQKFLECVGEHTKSKVADGLARKAIRALISAGAGILSYKGPLKLFLLVRSSTALNLPMHFLPKRDLQFSKKVVPFKLLVKCKGMEQVADNLDAGLHSTSNDMIWYPHHMFIVDKNSSISLRQTSSSSFGRDE